MNLFDALLSINVALAVIALVRLRPASLIWFGQQSITIRALSNIRDYGPPSSQFWLPASLFNPSALDTAWTILAISTLISGLALALPASRAAPPLEAADQRRLPRWLLAIVWLFFLGATLSRRSIFSAASATDEAQNFAFNLGGGNALMCGLLLYDMELHRAAGRISGRTAFAIVTAVLTVSFLLKGSTGYVTGCLVFAAFVYLAGKRWGRMPGYLVAAAAILLLIASTMMVRLVRNSLASGGTEVVSDAVEQIQEVETSRAQTGRGAEALMNGDQSAAHVVECISLWESGIGRDWRSVYNPIIYTFEPAVLLEPLGLTRPREAAYELMDYYLHLGGIEVLGELYWNGGYLCVVVVLLAICWFHWRCDIRMRHSDYWLMMACNYTPGILMGAHYGLAQMMRGVGNGLIACLVLRLLGRRGLVAQPRAAITAAAVA